PKATRMDLVIGTLALRPYVFAFLALFLVAGFLDVGWRRTLVFGAAVWPLAWLAEFASTRVGFPFGLYHYTGITRGRELHIGNVPFMDSLSFTFLAYASFCLARVAGSRAILRGARIQLGRDRVDRRVGAAGPRRTAPRHNRRDDSTDAPDAGEEPGFGASGSAAGMSVPLSQMWAVASYVIRQR